MSYQNKYLKYKKKYIELKSQLDSQIINTKNNIEMIGGGGKPSRIAPSSEDTASRKAAIKNSLDIISKAALETNAVTAELDKIKDEISELLEHPPSGDINDLINKVKHKLTEMGSIITTIGETSARTVLAVQNFSSTSDIMKKITEMENIRETLQNAAIEIQYTHEDLTRIGAIDAIKDVQAAYSALTKADKVVAIAEEAAVTELESKIAVINKAPIVKQVNISRFGQALPPLGPRK
jgi:hypothetical protein